MTGLLLSCLTIGFDSVSLPPKPIVYSSALKYRQVRSYVSAYIQKKNPKLPKTQRDFLIETIMRKAGDLHTPDYLKMRGKPIHPVYFLTSVIAVESSFDPNAVSPKGALGYMQIMPATLHWLNQRNRLEVHISLLFETQTNLFIGVSYLNYLIPRLRDIRLVCLAYNAGEGNLRRGYWVEDYWKSVLSAYQELQDSHHLHTPTELSVLGRGTL